MLKTNHIRLQFFVFVIIQVFLLTGCAFFICAKSEDVKKFTSGDYTYILLDDGSAEIKKYGGKEDKVTIPEKLGNIKVSALGDNAFTYSKVTTVTIPNYITSINGNPFNNCKKLSTIIVAKDHPTLTIVDGVLFSKPDKRLVYYPPTATKKSYSIPQGILTIGEYAFSKATISSISIPDSVVSIEDDAFFDSQLRSITIPDSVQTLGVSVFFYCEQLQDVKLGQGIKHLPNSTFYDCTSLAEIKIPETVETMGDNVFFACKALKTISLAKITSIGDSVFGGCFELTSVFFPGTLTHIGNNPFDGCIKLQNVDIAPENEYFTFDNNVLYSNSDKRLICYLLTKPEKVYHIPEGTLIIDDYAFDQAKNIQEIIIPDSIIEIGESAFMRCQNLQTINLPEKNTVIRRNTFSGCIRLSSLEIPASVTAIEYNAFENCRSLNSLKIPSNVIEIDVKAFNGCDDLTLTVEPGSYAEQFCKENKINHIFSDAFDWLI